jgi:hypothetical protein
MQLKHIFLYCISFLSAATFAQSGGDNFSILQNPVDARSMALGNNAMLNWDADMGKALFNPALLNEKMLNSVEVDHVFGGGINISQIGYARKNKKWDLIQSYSLQFANYGKQTETTPEGVIIGDFRPYDVILQYGLAKNLNEQWQIGAQTKWIHSGIASYFAQGLYFDFSGIYTSKNKKTLASFLVRNAGVRYKSFFSNSVRNNPLEMKLSVSNKPEHMPFRWMLTLEQLQDPVLTYTDPDNFETDEFSQTTTYKEPSFGNKVLRHLNASVEMVLTEDFNLRLGYDFARREELSGQSYKGMTGFSWGFSFRAKKLKFAYGRSTYHVAGGLNSISLQMDLSSFTSKVLDD